MSAALPPEALEAARRAAAEAPELSPAEAARVAALLRDRSGS